MKNVLPQRLIFLYGLPGIALSSFACLGILSGGSIFGISVAELIDCGLRALPLLFGIAGLSLSALFRLRLINQEEI